MISQLRPSTINYMPTMDQIYDIDTQQLCVLRCRITQYESLSEEQVGYREQLLATIDLELEERKTLQFFSEMLKLDNPYLEKLNHFKNQFVRLAEITLQNQSHNQHRDTHMSNHSSLKDTNSQCKNNESSAISEKDVDCKSVQFEDKKMNLANRANPKNKKQMLEFIQKTLIKSKVNQFHVISKNNQLPDIPKPNKAINNPSTNFKKHKQQQHPNSTSKNKNKQIKSQRQIADKMKQIKQKMQQKTPIETHKVYNNKKLVDMVKQQQRSKKQRKQSFEFRQAQKKNISSYQSNKVQPQIVEEIIQQPNSKVLNIAKPIASPQYSLTNQQLIKQTSKQIIKQEIQTLEDMNDSQQKKQQIFKEEIQEKIQVQQQKAKESNNQNIQIAKNQTQSKKQSLTFIDQQAQKQQSKQLIAQNKHTQQKNQPQTAQIQQQAVISQKVSSNIQLATEINLQNNHQSTINLDQKLQPNQSKQNITLNRKQSKSKLREHKQYYNEQYWAQIRQQAQLKIQRFKLEKQLEQKSKQIEQKQIIIRQNNYLAQKNEQNKIINLENDELNQQNKQLNQKLSQNIDKQKLKNKRVKSKLTIPKKIYLKPTFNYLQIFPTFDHLFSLTYVKNPGQVSSQIFTTMKDIANMFVAHIDKMKVMNNNFQPAIFLPFDCPGGISTFSSLNPRNMIQHCQKTFIDLKKMVQRLQIFNQNINGQYKSFLDNESNKQKTQTQYYRVIKTKEQVYDIITTSFLRRRNWKELPHGCSLKTTWNLFWSWGKPDLQLNKLLTVQKINHFPYNKNLSRKDLLYKNLDSFRKNLKILMPFLPTTFVLPKQFSQFSTKFHQDAIASPFNYWIMKPIGKSRGRGIKVITNLSQLNYMQNIVVQKYISNPLLIQGYKFDMRIYVLVTSFHPLQAFLYREGFARLSTQKFTLDVNSIKNSFIHLTNFAIQKNNKQAKNQQNQYEKQGLDFGSGSKISLKNLKGRLTNMGYSFSKIWSQVQQIIIKSLLACSVHVPIFPSSFQLFGYDIMLDETGACHLIQINSSPSLQRAYMIDEVIKQALIDDIIDIVDPPQIDKEQFITVVNERALAKKKMSEEEDLIDLGRIFKNKPIRKIGEIPKKIGLFQMIAPGQLSLQIQKNIKSRSGSNNMHNID